MTNASPRPGRIGQSQYWKVFGAYMILVPGMLIGGLFALFTGHWGIGIGAILLLLPLGIYVRIAMMRRCRDIGWPAFLPWLLFVLPVVFSFFGGVGLGSMNTVPTLAALAMPLAISLVDFVFAITIGCIASKPDEDLAQLFGPSPGDPAPARPIADRDEPWSRPPQRDPAPGANLSGEADYSSFDAAVARALEARRNPQPQPAAAPEPIPAQAHARAVTGFGRKVV